jgi:hypothetical protein
MFAPILIIFSFQVVENMVKCVIQYFLAAAVAAPVVKEVVLFVCLAATWWITRDCWCQMELMVVQVAVVEAGEVYG